MLNIHIIRCVVVINGAMWRLWGVDVLMWLVLSIPTCDSGPIWCLQNQGKSSVSPADAHAEGRFLDLVLTESSTDPQPEGHGFTHH